MSPAVKWVGAIGVLLGVNVIACVVLATIANDGGSQVIPEYYDRAAHFDDARDQAARDRALDWHVGTTLDGAGVLGVTVRDASGAPIDGARVRVTGYQRAHSNEPFDVVLPAIGGGRYAFSLATVRAGRHDLALTIDRELDHVHYTQRVVVDVP